MKRWELNIKQTFKLKENTFCRKEEQKLQQNQLNLIYTITNPLV